MTHAALMLLAMTTSQFAIESRGTITTVDNPGNWCQGLPDMPALGDPVTFWAYDETPSTDLPGRMAMTAGPRSWPIWAMHRYGPMQWHTQYPDGGVSIGPDLTYFDIEWREPQPNPIYPQTPTPCGYYWTPAEPIVERLIGDATADGSFDTADIIAVFQAGKYEAPEAADWAAGDFNFDARFDTADLVLALAAGTYTQPAAASPVPEPSSFSGWLLGLAALLTRMRPNRPGQPVERRLR